MTSRLPAVRAPLAPGIPLCRRWASHFAFLLAGAGAVALQGGDVTESPFTLEPGQWYLEVDPVRVARERAGGAELQLSSHGESLLGFGWRPDTELQVTWLPYVQLTSSTAGLRARTSGTGNLTLRVNHNLLRREDDRLGVSILPYVTLPTGSRHFFHSHLSGGVIIPAAWALSESTALSAMIDLAGDRNEVDDGYRLLATLSASLDSRMTERVAAYLEVTVEADVWHPDDWHVNGGLGVVLSPWNRTEVTLGLALGLTRPATDHEAFARIAWFW